VTTWEEVHAGDVVLGHDGQVWGVAAVVPGSPAGPIVTLTRHGVTTGPAQPPPGTPITILERADSAAEARAFGALSAAGLGPQLIEERIAI
jgi:hypothetical protein